MVLFRELGMLTVAKRGMSSVLKRPAGGDSEATTAQMSQPRNGGGTAGSACRMRSPILYFLVFSFSAVSWIVLLSGISSVQYWCGGGT